MYTSRFMTVHIHDDIWALSRFHKVQYPRLWPHTLRNGPLLAILESSYKPNFLNERGPWIIRPMDNKAHKKARPGKR